jgi:ferredoxin
MDFIGYYFSATGNTERSLKLIDQELAKASAKLNLRRIEDGIADPAELSASEGLILAFPVLAMGPPGFVKRFIKALPHGSGKAAYVLAVDGGGGQTASEIAADLLRRRGYEVRVSAPATYPDNWTQVYSGTSDQARAALLGKGDAMAMEFASLVLSGEISVYRPETGNRIVGRTVDFLFTNFGRRFLGKMYVADSDCDACGLCARACPTGVIAMGKGKGERPYWNYSCEDCNRCINICPRKAIVTSVGRIGILIGVAVAAAWAGIWAYQAFAAPALAALIPAWSNALIGAAAIIAIIVLAHVAIGPFDKFILRYVQKLPLIRRFFEWTFMKDARRYVEAGFKPRAAKRGRSREPESLSS